MTGMRSVVIVDGFPEEVGRNVDAREDDTDELFVGDCAPMIRIHHAEHGSSLGGPYVFHARPLRHVFQKARELLLVEGTRAVFVDFEKLLVLARGKVAMSAGRVTSGVCGGHYKGVSLQVAGGLGGGDTGRAGWDGTPSRWSSTLVEAVRSVGRRRPFGRCACATLL